MADLRSPRFEPTPAAPGAARASYVREGVLLLGFVVIVAASIVTVALPELSDAAEPEEKDATAAPTTAQSDAGT
jgi:hypothetical protein